MKYKIVKRTDGNNKSHYVIKEYVFYKWRVVCTPNFFKEIIFYNKDDANKKLEDLIYDDNSKIILKEEDCE
jgi:hypothetical protein